jgi:hypothetical protein
MKKNGLLLTLLLISFAFLAEAKTKVTKKNGGKDGYKNIEETHTSTTHKLSCSDPGRESCTWNQGNGIATIEQLTSIDTFIEDQLSNGTYMGTGNLIGTDLWFYWLYSSATGELNYTVAEDEPDYEF